MECFSVYTDEIEGRIDPSPYHPIRLNTIKKIKSSKYELLLLKEVVEFRKKIVNSKSKDLIYVGLENIESNTGIFIPPKEEKEAFGSAFLFQKGDILFPKLRPYLNKVYLAEFDGVCSTEFHVLTPIKCDGLYLFTFLNSQLVVNQTSYLMTGNTLPRLQTGEIESIIIPLPPKNIQEKIKQKIQEAYTNNNEKQSEAQKLLDSINDYVVDELGIKLSELKDKMVYVVDSEEAKSDRLDPRYYKPYFKEFEAELSKRKDNKNIGQISEYVGSGATPKAGGDDYTSKEEGIPFIRIVNLKNNTVVLDNVLYIKHEIHEGMLKRTQLKPNDVLLSMAGTIGLSVVVPKNLREANINQAIARIVVKNNVNQFYLSALLNSKVGKIQTDRLSRPAVQANINLEEIRALKIPLPPLAVQNKIAEEVKRRMRKAEQLQKEAKDILEKAKEEVEKMIRG